MFPIALAGAAVAGAAYVAVHVGGRVLHLVAFRAIILLVLAVLASSIVYGLIVLVFRNRLPLGTLLRQMRLFVALALPDVVAEGLAMLQSGVPGARWQTREQMHLTLRFIGEVDGRDANAVDDALSIIEAPRFTLALKGVGEFGGKKPHALWAGVRDKEPVMFLHRKIETALQRAGLPADPRKFSRM